MNITHANYNNLDIRFVPFEVLKAKLAATTDEVERRKIKDELNDRYRR